MNQFLACDVLKFFIQVFYNKKHIVGSWNEINICYTYKSFSVKLDYVMSLWYIYWVTIYCTCCEARVHEFFVYAEFWMVNIDISLYLLHDYFLSIDVIFTSFWTLVFMYQGSNHSEMVNVFIVLVVWFNL